MGPLSFSVDRMVQGCEMVASQAAPCRAPQVSYRNMEAAAALAEPGMLAVIGFGAGRAEADDPRWERRDVRYAKLKDEEFPRTECLKDTVARVLPFWNESMAPAIRAGKRVLVAAHGNSIRALVKYLDGISDDDIVGLNIPNGIPLVYELDEALKPVRHYYLGDAEAAAKAAAAVAAQGKGG